MKATLAIEWFLNPDHLPFIVGIREGIFEKNDIELEVIEPTEHYDGLEELRQGNITFATNEPLHLIEQFDEEFLTMGTYFETKGGVLLKKSSYDKLKNGENITVTSPVSNDKTNTIAFEIIRRFYAKEGVEVKRDQVEFVANGFEHLKYMKEGADAGWLYFYNFEGIEAQHEGMEVLYLDAKNVGFANFSALDIFVNKSWYKDNTQACETFVNAVKEAITWMEKHPAEAMAHYYEYTKAEKSGLMDDILTATLECFHDDFHSVASDQEPILEFFTEIGITKLAYDDFKKAFLN
jgi:ABC-type nitrate/sulfonate/bicarbonate transport system substrate-binding protein